MCTQNILLIMGTRPADFTFLVGGEAGQGVQTIGSVLGLSMTRAGYHVFSNQDYESRVRGGHNFFKVRVSNQPILAVSEKTNIMVALNRETIDLHRQEVAQDGLTIFDAEKTKVEAEPRLLSVPFERLALEKTGNKVMSNTVALAAALSLVEYDLESLKAVLKKTFGLKSSEVYEKNAQAAEAGYNYVYDNFKEKFGYALPAIGKPGRMLLSGADAVALGASAAGCKFMSGYPMTPTTEILQYFADKAEALAAVFEPAEDEISALNMVLGASFAGVRAMTATSGGGFSLMVEALSLSGMTETPAVIVLGQRPGPATGFPTRTEQGELEFAIHAAHGTFPRAVFAPGTAEEAFYLTAKAFNVAEKYQVPAIVLIDQHIADSQTDVERFDLSRVTIDRGKLLSDDEIRALGKYNYLRYKLTESGVSPRAVPGQPDALVAVDSDEHTEDGHITESAEVRSKMVDKRLRKLEGLRGEIAAPREYGPKEAGTVLVCWGSTYGALREAVDRVNGGGGSVRMLHLSEVWPFPREAFTGLVGDSKFIVVESNATGQMAHLIRAETGLAAAGKILRFDGRPLTPAYILWEFHEGGWA